MTKIFQDRVPQVIIFVFAFFLYANTINHDFAWDDKIVIQENERVKEGVSGIPDLFLKYNTGLRRDSYGYRPITLTTFAIDYAFFGENPAGFHFMSALYFSLLCLVVYRVLRKIFEGYSASLAFLVTILFAAHPLHSEVVANIKSRDEILALLFAFLSLFYFLKFYEKQKWKHLIFGAFLFFIAFLSKENAFSFLAVYPLAILIRENWEWKKLLITCAIVPILALGAIFILNTALSSNLGVEITEDLGLFRESNILGNSFFFENNWGQKFSNATQLITLYIKNFLVPDPLTYYNGLGEIEPLRAHWKTLTGVLILLFTIVFSILRWKKNPIMIFGLLFFFITILGYLQVFISLSDTFADRFAFIPSLGLCIVLVGLLGTVFKHPFKKGEEKAVINHRLNSLKKIPAGMKGLVFLLIGAFSILTISRNKVWKDDFTLVSHDMPYLENSPRPHYYYATILNQKMVEEGWDSNLEKEMIYHYQQSMALSDSIYYGRLELGIYFCKKGNLNQGILVLEETARLFPKTSDPHFYLGNAYFQKERYQDAVDNLEIALKLASGYSDSYHLLAIAYSKIGEYEKAIFTANDRLEKFPSGELSYYEELGHIYFEMGNLEASANNTLKMIEHGGDAFTAYATVIGRYQNVANEEMATYYYQQAIDIGIMKAQ